jgi:hypothetical protein
MSGPQVYAKTAKALEEIQSKKYKLKPKVRNLLFLIDGSKPVVAVAEMSRQLGMSDSELIDLETDGFIVKTVAADVPAGGQSAGAPARAGAAPTAIKEEAAADEAGKFRVAKKYMNDTIVNLLGLKAFFFTLKLEKCGTRADLAQLLDSYGQAIAKASNIETSKVLVRRARELVS